MGLYFYFFNRDKYILRICAAFLHIAFKLSFASVPVSALVRPFTIYKFPCFMYNIYKVSVVEGVLKTLHTALRL